MPAKKITKALLNAEQQIRNTHRKRWNEEKPPVIDPPGVYERKGYPIGDKLEVLRNNMGGMKVPNDVYYPGLDPDGLPTDAHIDSMKLDDTRLKVDVGYYAINLNPDDRHQYFDDVQRIAKVRAFVTEHVIQLKMFGINYHLNFEFSEPMCNVSNQRPRLHCHGVIEFTTPKSVKSWLLNQFEYTGRNSHMFIRKLENNGWIQYMSKQQHIIEEKPITNSDNFLQTILMNVNQSPEGGKGDKNVPPTE